ncbi:AraC family transcriptional regulator [Actinoplanes sp. KI2]|uniref:helix-turn-helix transcriptional regulator n=1 Tax=Actinoplanes sp. KI2 TaxID=2983315 RepID=UPI0021D5B8FB|nr:AraC family transcriptional regulator [Actinoplanes sp. KI2]MCU7723873.1 AraC family transcriptional regulator [Actinoplanes sp. KI2]
MSTTVMREPQRRRIEFATTDPGWAEDYLTTAYEAAIAITGAGRNYRFRHVRLDPGPFHLDTVDHEATTGYRCGPFPMIVVTRIHRGMRIDRDLDERLGPGGLLLHPPGRRYHLRHESVFSSLVSIDPQAVAEVARNKPDDPTPPLRFCSAYPAGPAAARDWLRVVRYITDSMKSSPEFIAHPLMIGPMTRLLAATLLATFPNTCIPEPHHQDRSDATETAMSRAKGFIDTNADLDITLVEIARAARVTVRAVQAAFRRHLGTTPTAYLRRVRLERAHEQLMTAQPGDGTTVTAVAAQWGYTDPRRFAADYRRVHGHLPEQSLIT